MSAEPYSSNDRPNRNEESDTSLPEPARESDNADGSTLYISNLNSHFTVSDLNDMFSKFGDIQDSRIIQNPITRESRGFGFISYAKASEADKAIDDLNGREIEGRMIRIERARRKKPHDPTPGFYRGPPGASVKYDNRGKLRPGFLPYYACNPHRNSRSRDSDRYRNSRASRRYSPPRNYNDYSRSTHEPRTYSRGRYDRDRRSREPSYDRNYHDYTHASYDHSAPPSRSRRYRDRDSERSTSRDRYKDTYAHDYESSHGTRYRRRQDVR